MIPPRVAIGYHSWGLVSDRFAWSLARSCAYSGNKIQGVLPPVRSPYTDEARNQIVAQYLGMVDRPKYLLMLDGDIEFLADSVDKTINIAEHHNADVVWGNYALGDGRNSIFTTDVVQGTEFALGLEKLNVNYVYRPVYAGGTGWVLMKGDLLQKMRVECEGPWYWFARDVITDHEGKVAKMGEDLTFGKRAHSLGAVQIGYTGLFLQHWKMIPLVPDYLKDMAPQMGFATMYKPPLPDDQLVSLDKVTAQTPVEKPAEVQQNG